MFWQKRFPSGRSVALHAISLLLVLLCLLASGCGRKRAKATAPVSTRPPMPSVIGATEEGVASWYGHPYHGRRTANGEVYDMEQMTAAHPSLQFNVWVDVLNLDNGLRTQVRINDRGPFAKNRAIDLSHAAARAIAMVGPGTANVRVTVIAPPTPAREPPIVATTGPPPAPPRSPDLEAEPQEAGFAVQAGAFRSYENALQFRDRLLQHAEVVRILHPGPESAVWRVWVGEKLSRDAAMKIIEGLRADFPRIFLVSDH